MKVSRVSPQSNSEIITNEHEKEIPKEICICSEDRHKIINDLILI